MMKYPITTAEDLFSSMKENNGVDLDLTSYHEMMIDYGQAENSEMFCFHSIISVQSTSQVGTDSQ